MFEDRLNTLTQTNNSLSNQKNQHTAKTNNQALDNT